MGDQAAAQDDFDRAIELSKRRPEAYLHRAWLRFDQARYTEGLDDALQAKQLNRGDLAFEAHVLEVLGFQYCALGNLSLALAPLDRFLQLRPDDPIARVRRAQAFRLGRDLERARLEADAALTLAPDNVEARTLRMELG
jgi:tetratricopeptide (TPR) repeat protein